MGKVRGRKGGENRRGEKNRERGERGKGKGRGGGTEKRGVEARGEWKEKE